MPQDNFELKATNNGVQYVWHVRSGETVYSNFIVCVAGPFRRNCFIVILLSVCRVRSGETFFLLILLSVWRVCSGETIL